MVDSIFQRQIAARLACNIIAWLLSWIGLYLPMVKAAHVDTPIGVCFDGRAVDASLPEDWYEYYRGGKRMVIVANAATPGPERLNTILRTLLPTQICENVAIVYAPAGNAVAPKRGIHTPDASIVFPPTGTAYNQQNCYSHYLWRWLLVSGPDVVVVPTLRMDDTPSKPDALRFKSLSDAIDREKSSGRRHFEVRFIEGTADELPQSLQSAIEIATTATSSSRKEITRRTDRDAQQVIENLLEVYGDHLDSVTYIPALALIVRLEYGRLTHNDAHVSQVKSLAATYAMSEKTAAVNSGSALGGHLLFTALARASTDPREKKSWLEAARRAADERLAEPALQAGPGFLMPHHHEMSDAVFMGGPILAEFGRLTDDVGYLKLAVEHLNTTREMNLRAEGIYRHSPWNEAPWGRGNGFPALGQALVLSQMRQEDYGYHTIREATLKHMRSLRHYQDPSGCWHQIIERPETYCEFSSTCMIGFSIARGIERGWLPSQEFQPVLRKAWHAIKARTSQDGTLHDVCTGTGKQPAYIDYYNRTAIYGTDDRGGAMALLFALEMFRMQLERN